MTPPTEDFRTVLRHGVRRARNRAGLSRARLAVRMAGLGYPWHPQTVSNVEEGRRRVPAEELLGLGLALECPVSDLTAPWGGLQITPDVQMPDGGILPSGTALAIVGRGTYRPWVRWIDDRPQWPSEELTNRVTDLERRVAKAEAAMENAHYEWDVAAAQASEPPRSLQEQVNETRQQWLDLRDELRAVMEAEFSDDAEGEQA